MVKRNVNLHELVIHFDSIATEQLWYNVGSSTHLKHFEVRNALLDTKEMMTMWHACKNIQDLTLKRH
ncbi:hypothetical protein BGZ93_004083 [Podila epicladia]|nr:hypothetical protein BGZ93_004083 [Podila epicladia]